jgi:DNA-binding response OmpR family regulator
MGIRVLAIDYDRDILRLVEIKLRRAGFEVLTTANSDQALATILSHRPDVLLTEVMLPGRDGTSIVAEAKKQLGEAAPIAILLSHKGQEADIVAGLASGADDYIVKPFSPRELIERITVALIKAGRHARPAAPGSAPGEGGA